MRLELTPEWKKGNFFSSGFVSSQSLVSQNIIDITGQGPAFYDS
jgi:hypothetical protein